MEVKQMQIFSSKSTNLPKKPKDVNYKHHKKNFKSCLIAFSKEA